MGYLAIPAAGLGFFFSAWLTMMFCGIIATDLGIEPIGYIESMLVTIALWLVVAPLIAASIRKTKGH